MTELRKDPIIDNWVIISTERGRRPLDYKIKKEEKKKIVAYSVKGMKARRLLKYLLFGKKAPGKTSRDGK